MRPTDERDATTPSRVWFALLRRLGRGISGRRFTVRGTTFAVASLHGRPEGAGFSPGRVRDAHAVLVDVDGPDLTAREVRVHCDSLVVGPVLAATGITVTATLETDAVRAMMAEADASGEFDVVDGELRSRWVTGIDVVVRPRVHRDQLQFVPVATITPLGRWPVAWLPSVSAPLPELPGGLRLVEVGTTHDAVVITATADAWSASARDRPREVPAA